MLNSVATLTLSVATGIRGNAQNKMYPQTVKITNLQELFDAVQFDHVAGTFTNNERGTAQFMNADCLMMDCDNTHSTPLEDHLTPEGLAERLPDVVFYIVYSKSHQKAKGTHSPAPRYHVYFPLSKSYVEAAKIADMKAALLKLIPEFDAGAKDAARFFFGVPDPHGEAFTGTVPVDEYLAEHAGGMFTASDSTPNLAKSVRGEILSETPSLLEQMIASQNDCKGYFDFTGNPDKIIPEGNRHNVLLQIAVGAIANEDIDSARQTYEKACRQCVPPHDKADIASIWNDAKDYVKAMQAKQEQEGKKKKSRPLSMADIERVLDSHKITVRYNVITKTYEVLNMPETGYTIPKAYAKLSEYERRSINVKLLPLCLTPMLKNAGYTFSAQFIKDSITALALQNKYNPVKAMIDRTTWDKQDRIDKLCKVLGIIPDDDDNDTFSDSQIFFCRTVEKWLHQAIALGLNDEGGYCQNFVLTLQGAQGIGKTLLFRKLAVFPDWFRGGTVINMADKDSKIESVSTWICELGELDSTMKKEQSSLKGHITEHRDTIRMPYGETWDTTPRRTCYCATVNPEQVHRDDTGSRRFVYLHVEHIDLDFILHSMTPEWCAHLWRQVYEQYYMPNPAGYFLTKEEQAYSEKSNEEFRVPLKAETELRDLINFEDCYLVDDNGYPINAFAWYTASEVKSRLKLRMYSANQIGEALKYLCIVHPHCERSRSHGKTKYFLPAIAELDED